MIGFGLLGALIALMNTTAGPGKTFVKAYHFLIHVDDFGTSVDDANSICSSLFENWSDPDHDDRIILRAIQYSKDFHGGKQLPIIAEARAKGFSG